MQTRPYVKLLPGVSAGGEAVKNLAGVRTLMRDIYDLLLISSVDGDRCSFEAPCRAS